MRAEEAIEKATADLIKADAKKGIVTIYRSRSDAGCDYHVRFIPRDANGNLRMPGAKVVGTWPTLQEASAAAGKYGVSGDTWTPQEQVELHENSRGALQVEGKAAGAEGEGEE